MRARGACVRYEEFLETKERTVPLAGKLIDDSAINPKAHKFQRAIIRWNCKLGRAADWLDTGLGKTLVTMNTCAALRAAVVKAHEGDLFVPKEAK